MGSACSSQTEPGKAVGGATSTCGASDSADTLPHDAADDKQQAPSQSADRYAALSTSSRSETEVPPKLAPPPDQRAKPATAVPSSPQASGRPSRTQVISPSRTADNNSNNNNNTNNSVSAATRKDAPVPSVVRLLTPRHPESTTSNNSSEPVKPARRPGSGSSRRSLRVGRPGSFSNAGVPRPPHVDHSRHGSLVSSTSSGGGVRVVPPEPEESAGMMRLMSGRGSLLTFGQTGERMDSMRRVNSQVSFTCSDNAEGTGEATAEAPVWGASPSQNSIMVHDGGIAQRTTPPNPALRMSSGTFGARGYRKSQLDDDEASITRVKALMRRRRTGEACDGDSFSGGDPLSMEHSSVEDAVRMEDDDGVTSCPTNRLSRRSPTVRCFDVPAVKSPKIGD